MADGKINRPYGGVLLLGIFLTPLLSLGHDYADGIITAKYFRFAEVVGIGLLLTWMVAWKRNFQFCFRWVDVGVVLFALYGVGRFLLNDFWGDGKVYRDYFSVQTTNWAVSYPDEDIPGILKNPFLRDVSDEYFGRNVAVVPLYDSAGDGRLCYLAVFNNAGWSPVAVGTAAGFQGVFNNIDTAIVYLPVYHREGKLTAAGDPFIYTKNHEVKSIRGGNERVQKMHLVKKYTGTAMDRLLLDLMVQGVFEGANTPDFRDAVVLHRITKVPLPDSNWVRVNCPSEFRYLRYRGPKGSNSCIAEAMFFDADGKLIRGACIGTPSAENGKTWDCTKVYDGSKHTYFAAQDADTSWAGLQLAIPVRVSRICYIPRNDDNFVKPGDLYELLVWDRGQWYTMGRQVPDTYGLDYEGVPAGHLYWLRDLTEGVEERIFTYEQGKQVWW